MRLGNSVSPSLVLAEVAVMVTEAGRDALAVPQTVPFFDNRGNEPLFLQLS